MMTALVLTVIGPDRPGLVESLSQTLAAHEGNWEESRMASLAGQFAGILLVTAPEQRAGALSDALRGLAGQGLRVEVAVSTVEPPAPRRGLRLALVGQDRHGIVRDIAHALAALNINIDELETEVTSASWSGEALFHATADLRLPDDVADEDVRAALEGLANELMVDISLDVPPPV
jgi:glycine cleavage system regulatory protein